MARQAQGGPHRLYHTENPADVLRPLSSFSKGDVVVLESNGTPCMVSEVQAPDMEVRPLVEGNVNVWITNLINGSVYSRRGTDAAWPCTDVHLSFTSMRRS